jgi:hypothetical protein
MKKVAICLKGAVSKKGKTHDRFYHPNELYRNGDYIDFLAVNKSIIKHIVKANSDYEFDFFLHGWNLDLESQLVEIYNPKKYLFENNENYNSVISYFIANSEDFGGVSGGLSIKKSLELKEIYEIESNSNYDVVIVYRYDVLLWKDMILDEYDVDKYIYVNQWYGECNADFHFVMSNNNSHKFKYLYDSVVLYNNFHKFHHWIKNYVINILKCELKEDNLTAGIFQEHMRVIGDTPSLTKSLIDYL